MRSSITTSLLALVAAGAIACGGGARDDRANETTNTPAATADDTNRDVTGTTGAGDTMNRDLDGGGIAGRMGVGTAGFIREAALDGMAEVELGRLAQQKAQSAEVKAFAQQLMKDHQAANQQLKQIASQASAEVPAALEGDHKDHVERLSQLQGAEFDREYVEMMVDDHKKAVENFREQAQKENHEHPQVKQFASQTLPKLEQHLERAQQLQQKLERGGGNRSQQ